MKKNICVFCSSSDALEEVFYQEAKSLGTLISEHHWNLVYGGTSVGLMHEVAQAVRDNGGHVIGVIPQKIKDNGIASKDADELIITADMKERKAVMREKSDAFIALPGGFGTLEEILEVITLKQLGYHNLPVVFIDVNGFYSHLIQQFEMFYENRFAKEDYRKMYYIALDSKEALEYIRDYKAEQLTQKWY